MSHAFRGGRRWAAVAGLVAATLSLAACSSDDNAKESSTVPTTISTAPTTEATAASTTVPSSSSTPAAGTSATPPVPIAPSTTSAPSTSDTTTAPDASPAPVATTTVPAGPTTPPTTGDITQTVPVEPQETLPSVALDQPAPVGDVDIVIQQVERIQAEARLPGEIAGPAFAVHVRITNNSDAAIDLSEVAVNLFDASGAVAPTLTAAPAAPFSGQIAAGESVDAVYVFQFPNDRPQPVRVEVSRSADTPVAVFVGTVK